MTNRHDEQLIKKLYQERVQKTAVPHSLKAAILKQTPKRWHWRKIVSLLALSTGLSFSIYALFNHLSQLEKQPQVMPIIKPRAIEVELSKQPIADDKIVVIVEPLPTPPKKVLPPKPKATTIKPSKPTLPEQQQMSGIELPKQPSNSTEITFTQPLTLTYKVMPIYPKAAYKKQISATVVLSYSIDENGFTSAINVLSDSPKLFNKSAITALKQWQFSVQSEQKTIQNQIVEFVFKLPK